MDRGLAARTAEEGPDDPVAFGSWPMGLAGKPVYLRSYPLDARSKGRGMMVEQCASDGAEARGYFEAVAHKLMRLRFALENARAEIKETWKQAYTEGRVAGENYARAEALEEAAQIADEYARKGYVYSLDADEI